MKIVNIYIATNSASTWKSKKRYGYVMECLGHHETREGFGESESTDNGIHLVAIVNAMKRINQTCEVHIFAESRYVLGMMDMNLTKWASNDFKTSKGKPVKDEKLWRELYPMYQKHLVVPEYGHHTFTEWIKEEIERRAKHEHDVSETGKKAKAEGI